MGLVCSRAQSGGEGALELEVLKDPLPNGALISELA